MLYEMYQAQRDWTAPANALATFTSRCMELLPEPFTDNPPMRFFSAMNEMVARSRSSSQPARVRHRSDHRRRELGRRRRGDGCLHALLLPGAI